MGRKFVERVKTGAKKTWTWIKAHPGETCLMVGSAIIGGVTGSKIGQHKGYKHGHADAYREYDARRVDFISDMLDVDPVNMVNGYTAYMTHLHGNTMQEIVDSAKNDERIPDDATFSGILCLNGSELPPETK